MPKTIVGSFDRLADAERAASILADNGVERRRIQVVDNTSVREYQQRWSGEPQGSGFWSWLFGDVADEGGRPFPVDDSDYYQTRMTRGGALLFVVAENADVPRIQALFDRVGAQDVAARGEAGARGAKESRMADTETEKVIPVVEEQAKIGKRDVERGHVRVYSHVTERPIEEHLRLREERIRVERRPVDRPVGYVPAEAFKEQSFELTERAEEPVVEKRARIVEEVTIGKDVQEREETVRERVRRTDVEVERTGGGNFATMESDFRQHCTRMFGGRGLTYEQCSPAYRYGWDMAADQRYAGDWSAVEPQLRRDWEARHQGPWEQFKDAVRYAWDRARGKARAA